MLIGAIAEASAQKSEQLLQQALGWCHVAATSHNIDLLAFLLHVKHDETPVRARVHFPSNITGHSDMQVSKVHMCEVITSKVFALNKPLLSGIKHLSLFMSGSGVLARTRQILHDYVEETLVVEARLQNSSTNHGNQQYRECVLELFKLEGKRAPKVLAEVQTLLNADWEQKTLRHVCAIGVCCGSRAESVRKVQRILDQLLSLTRPRRKFAANNWLEWQKSWLFAGIFSSCHQLLFQLVPRVVEAESLKQPRGEAAEERRDNADFDDNNEMARRREEETQHRRSTLELVNNSSVKDELFIMFRALRAEMKLMASILAPSTPKWQMKEMMKLAGGEACTYAVLQCYEGVHFDKMLAEIGDLLSDDLHWNFVSRTEYNAALLWRHVLRAGATLHQLSVTTSQTFPYKAFKLLRQNPADAEELQALPGCVLDSFTAALRDRFATAESLLSDQFLCLLASIALRIDCSTFSTETKHSINLRQVLARAQTHAPEIELLGVRHQRCSSLPWMSALPNLARHPPSSAGNDGDEHADRPKRGRKRTRHKTRRGGGGAWRAFQSIRSAGQRLNPVALAQ